ncbi:MAG: WG repeat-containing protein [Rikenellaceae bacterium]
MISLVTQVLESVIEFGATCRVLGDLKFWRQRDGRILYYSGNSVVVFKVFYAGRWCSMRCYTREHSRLSQIYGERHYPQEFFIEGVTHSAKWIDVVLLEWIDGQPLGGAVREAARRGDKERMALISRNFDLLALEILNSDWSHGDLSGDNILVTPSGELHLIDYDAKYISDFEGEQSLELGTAAFQSPKRTASHFNADTDDYSIALISTALAVLAIDTTLYGRYSEGEGILLHAQRIASGEGKRALDVVVETLCRRGLAARYRIAKMLERGDVRCRGLKEALGYIYTQRDMSDVVLEVDIFEGYCGYITAEGDVVIPYIFNEAFEFRESLAAVELEGQWFYINKSGEVVINCKGCSVVKSFQGTVARVLKGDKWCYVNKSGEFIEYV